MEKNRRTDAFHKSVGRHIKLFRLHKQLTQKELGQKIGHDSSYVGYVERGQRNISLSVLRNIANALDVEPCEIVCDTPEHYSK